MRALIINHESSAPVDGLQSALAERGWECEEHVVKGPGAELPDPAGFELVAPLGAAWSAHDPEVAPTIAPELALIRRAHDSGVPVLGICFGSQLLATALGGRTDRAARAEFGFVDVETDDASLVPSGPWFQFHNDRFFAPDGARVIARNDAAPQAFVLGRSMGVQFHPEITPDVLEQWLDGGASGVLRRAGLDPDTILAEVRAQAVRTSALMGALLDAFLTKVAPAHLPPRTRD
ncbi:type 1 glutamine amidotransferase [Actinomadura rupiterrae]|uniref:type 1 glutamine amidotransferase n=1 Tax=Actinomadura rupiterrae TaxID=559627 RepID=UPI0020A544E5|nr:type 1 glutamine amidotransferase [Actinomadura rupiterrae]MCP2341866.1 GMP synthase-like glutamine amidotransferase [Actinomadura rupiterrae]